MPAQNERPEVAAPPDADDLEDDQPAAHGDSFGGFSARAGIRENTDITISGHATRTKRGILEPLIRRDDPVEHPVIVDVGGVEVVALDVGPVTKATTRVRWQMGPGTWGADVAEIARSTVIRDATDAEVQQDQSVDAEVPDVDEVAAT